MHDEALVELPQVLADEQVGDIVLVGHSDGASIALIYAAERPDACAPSSSRRRTSSSKAFRCSIWRYSRTLREG